MVNAGSGSGRRARSGGDRRRRPGRPADRSRQPRGAGPADHRSQLAHPGRDRRRRGPARCWPATIPTGRVWSIASEPKALKIGDRVVTSGEGGVFPPGLPVGVVAALDPGGARVEPYAELSQLDYVLLVDYGLAGGLPHPAPAGPGQKRRGKPAAGRRRRGRAERWRSSVLQHSVAAAGEQGPRAVSADRDGRCSRPSSRCCRCRFPDTPR